MTKDTKTRTKRRKTGDRGESDGHKGKGANAAQDPQRPPPDGTHDAPEHKKSSPGHLDVSGGTEKKAASYSPALHRSTIGAGGLNFSVRNGKRWDPAAITT